MGLWPAEKFESCWQDQTPPADCIRAITEHIIPQQAFRVCLRNGKKGFTNLSKCKVSFKNWPDVWNLRFIHYVSRTAGDGITSTRQSGQPRSQSKLAHKHKLSAHLSVTMWLYWSLSMRSCATSFAIASTKFFLFIYALVGFWCE